MSSRFTARGSLHGERGRKGVFITTSSFSNEARDYVKRIEKKIGSPQRLMGENPHRP
jgi:restriction endonuclease Mrr